MSYFCKIENNIVSEVIVADIGFISDGHAGNPQDWIENNDFVAIGYNFDEKSKVFYPPQPFANWVLDKSTWKWVAPIPYPNDEKPYYWDEKTNNWEPITFNIDGTTI